MEPKNLFSEIDALQKEIQKLRPFSAKNLQSLKDYFKIGLTFSSNALEGNTLTESETKIILEEGISIGGKPLKDHFEAIGHGEGFEKIFQFYKEKKITENMVKDLHQLFFHRIDDENAGQYREVKAFITGSKYPLPAPINIPKLMKACIKKHSVDRKNLHPVHAAALLHKDFVFIHPFIDGNGRVARLIMNLALLQEGYLIAIISPVLRADYIRLLEKAHANDQDFVQFIGESLRETQKDYLRIFG